MGCRRGAARPVRRTFQIGVRAFSRPESINAYNSPRIDDFYRVVMVTSHADCDADSAASPNPNVHAVRTALAASTPPTAATSAATTPSPARCGRTSRATCCTSCTRRREMTHFRPAPRVLLSADTTVAAVPRATPSSCRRRDPARRLVELPDHADVIALSPDGSWLATGAGHVTVVDCAHEPHVLAHTRVVPPLRQMQSGAALWSACREARTRRGARLERRPARAGCRRPGLGGRGPEGLSLDSEHARAVVWGAPGRACRPRRGRAVRAPVRGGRRHGQRALDRRGRAGGADGFLLPLAGGSLGVYDHEGLLVIAAGRWLPAERLAWATSRRPSPPPDGSHVAWVGVDADERTRVRVAEVATGTLSATPSCPPSLCRCLRSQTTAGPWSRSASSPTRCGRSPWRTARSSRWP